MTDPTANPKDHWEDVYRRKDARSVSWYRPHLEISLELLRQAGLGRQSRIVDVGAGASTLVDDLVELEVGDITALDLSAQALDVARQRLGDRARAVHWLPGDLLAMPFPEGRFDLWHDRAVLHFLMSDHEAEVYARQATRAVVPGGYAVIAGFAPDGPQRCSGLPVARRSATDIAALLAPGFALVDQRAHQHRTPGESMQSFVYALLRREPDPGM